MGGDQRLERRQGVFLSAYRRHPGCQGGLFSHQRGLVRELALDRRDHGHWDLRPERGRQAGRNAAAARLDQVHRRRGSNLFHRSTDRRPDVSSMRREVHLDDI